MDPSSLLEHLDHFYTNDWAVGKGGHCRVITRTMHSDHAPMILTIDEAPHSLDPCSCRIPNVIYSNEEGRSCILELWDREWDVCGDLAKEVMQALVDSSRIS